MAAGMIFLRVIHLESNGSSNPRTWENSGGQPAATGTVKAFDFDTSWHPTRPALPFPCPKHFPVPSQLTPKRSLFTCCVRRSGAHPPSTAGVGRVKAYLLRRLRFT